MRIPSLSQVGKFALVGYLDCQSNAVLSPKMHAIQKTLMYKLVQKWSCSPTLVSILREQGRLTILKFLSHPVLFFSCNKSKNSAHPVCLLPPVRLIDTTE